MAADGRCQPCLLGETVLEIVQASQFARTFAAVAGSNREPPKTPEAGAQRQETMAAEQTPLRARRAREKQSHRAAPRRAVPMPPRHRHAAACGPGSSSNRPRRWPWAGRRCPPTASPPRTGRGPRGGYCSRTPRSTPPPPPPPTAAPCRRHPRNRSGPTRCGPQSPPGRRLTSSWSRHRPSTLGSKLRSHGKALPERPVAVSPPPKAQASPAKARRCFILAVKVGDKARVANKGRLSLAGARHSGVGAGGWPGLAA
ncbi:hypothetical protein HU200_013784 [Digitaria exilis]|uniref:Uncharacterized protein n=1 Tax=Digitaria exilis TaxID=1010633 RepID=A0A835FDN0_9POAL|nr:hypothetical protein HU200_013784 [Digitaria exilis]